MTNRLQDRIGATEARLVRHLVARILRKGYAIDAREGENPMEARVRVQSDEVIRHIGHTEVTVLDVYRQQTDSKPLGYFILIHGNGCDVISDFSAVAELDAIWAEIEPIVDGLQRAHW